MLFTFEKSHGRELCETKHGSPKKEQSFNGVCRVCERSLLAKYGSTKSCVNLFRPSLKRKSFGSVWAERLRNVVGIHIKYFENSSQIVCNMFVGKISYSKFASDQKENVGGEVESDVRDCLRESLKVA